MDQKTEQYAAALGCMIRAQTVSVRGAEDDGRFTAFRALLKELFPALFDTCDYTEFPDGFVLRWQGRDGEKLPVLFMNHHDVVEANGPWKHGAFSAEIAEGKLWGRGTLDDKGGLWAMLQAADELIREGFVPDRELWFVSSSTEETDGRGADAIAQWFESRGTRFEMCFDEGGVILEEPIPGAKGRFAMIGIGEKGCADLKFIARSRGGHASIPEKDSPLVRLGKFMADADRQRIFTVEISPAICEMLRRFSRTMGAAGKLLARPERNKAVLKKLIPALSGKAAALLRTTIAFTMAGGSDGTNVIPTEAWVVGNMRYSHHQGMEASFDAVRKLAEKYNVELEILDPGTPSRLADHHGTAFRLSEKAVQAIFPGVIPVPYLMTGASDARFFDRVCDQCIRFLPFQINDQQLGSIHGEDENVDLTALVPAVSYYRYLMKEV
ncbi:MAG: M20/M25/M40 family metallo-hydrolase [Oscillospiraceae bacterium]|nr:M20/M25/M40 family metallo-hydrolase [Oscillospiraceae bacterium]